MTRKIKLSHGALIEATPEGQDAAVQSITGKFTGVTAVQGTDKLRFVFKDGDDTLHLTLRGAKRPATRLLVLLTNAVPFILDAPVTITVSDSRIRLKVEGQENEIEAPEELPRYSHYSNPRRSAILNEFVSLFNASAEVVNMSGLQAPSGTASGEMPDAGEGESSSAPAMLPLVMLLFRSRPGRNQEELVSDSLDGLPVEILAKPFFNRKKLDSYAGVLKDILPKLFPQGSFAVIKDPEEIKTVFTGIAHGLNSFVSHDEDDGDDRSDDGADGSDGQESQAPAVTVNENEEY